MRERLGGVLRTGPAGVSVKGKTNEGMGWIGRGEGLAVHAVALVDSMGGYDATWGATDEGLPV
jgi:2C-methyl-D-erythritol 2,4-cyclodiphosphate synthase